MTTPGSSSKTLLDRRLHGRKSCVLCRRRKQRCELPDDVDIAPSSEALEPERACHRCKVLSLPCVIEAIQKKTPVPKGKKREREETAERETTDGISDAVPPPGEAPAMKRASTTSVIALRGREVGSISSSHPSNAEIEQGIMSSFRPSPSDPSASNTPQVPGAAPRQAKNSLRYHGRPLELTSAMCRLAYGRTQRHRCGVADRALDAFWENDAGRLEVVYRGLCTYIPYLPEQLPRIQRDDDQFSSASILLSSLVRYLCILHNTEDANTDPSNLAQEIYNSQQTLLLQAPISLNTVQALDILSTFAPLGVLPGQAVQCSSIVRARGHVVIAQSIANAIHLDEEIRQAMSTGPYIAWHSDAVWTWLSLRASEATMALEEDMVIVPPLLGEANQAAEALTQVTLDQRRNLQDLAKLAVCERVLRLYVVHEALAAFRAATDDAASSLFSDAPEVIAQARKNAAQELELLSDRFDRLTSPYCPSHNWQSFRTIQLQTHFGVVQRIAIRTLLTSGFIPGANTALPILHTFAPPHLFEPTASMTDRIAYAMACAADPNLIARFFLQAPGSPAVNMVESWVATRGEGLEELLVAFADLRPDGDIMPLHQLIATALASSSVIIEIQAAWIVVTRSIQSLRRNVRAKQRLFMMRQAASTMRLLEPAVEDGQGTTLVGMASELIESMVRMADQRIKELEKETVDRRSSQGGATTAPTAAAGLPTLDTSAFDVLMFDMFNFAGVDGFGSDFPWQDPPGGSNGSPPMA